MILLWGSNARETHPIFFHHLLKGVHNGARLYVVDPRRTSSAQWADTGWASTSAPTSPSRTRWRARSSTPACTTARSSSAPPRLRRVRRERRAVHPRARRELTGLPAEAIREVAHATRAPTARRSAGRSASPSTTTRSTTSSALINLALLCGHVGRYGSGLNPLRGQNNVQGGGDMGAIPNKLPGLPGHRARRRGRAHEVRGGLGRADPRPLRLAPDADVRGHGARRAAHALRDRREPGAVRGRHQPHAAAARAASTSWSCRTSSSRRPASTPTSCCPRPPRGARPRARSPTPSGACSACARRSSRRARRATTRGS